MQEYLYRTKRMQPIIRVNEEWLDITLDEVLPIYKISNFGRVYSKLNNHLLKTNIINSGYIRVTLRLKNNKSKDYLVHRLEMITFRPIDNYEILQVNHIDGVKTNNYIGNLEWVTQSQNIKHAYETGLYCNGENHNFAILTEQQVHIICQGLVNRLSYKDICEKMLNVEYTEKMKSTISAIRLNLNWKHIRALYDIPESGRNDQFFSDEEIHNICNLFQQGYNINYILFVFGINDTNYTKEQIKNIREIINRIKRRERFTRISDHYNF